MNPDDVDVTPAQMELLKAIAAPAITIRGATVCGWGLAICATGLDQVECEKVRDDVTRRLAPPQYRCPECAAESDLRNWPNVLTPTCGHKLHSLDLKRFLEPTQRAMTTMTINAVEELKERKRRFRCN